MSSFLGIFYCDMCSHGMRQPVWTEGAARLCAEHYEASTGAVPPSRTRDAITTPNSLPSAEGAWQRIVKGLRARVRISGLEVQGCRNVDVGGTVEIGHGCSWLLGPAELVELFVLSSAYRDAPEAVKAQLRVQLVQLHEGKHP